MNRFWVTGNSASLRVSASTENLTKGKVEESHFSLQLNNSIFEQKREMDQPYFSL